MAHIRTVGFFLDQKFESFAVLQDFIKDYESHNFVQLWKRDSRTISAAKKRLTKELKESLVYYELKYCCIQGGAHFKSRGRGLRNASTFRQECPVKIALRASEDGQYLQVKSLNMEHNHDVCQELYNHLPSQRKLPEETQKEAEHMLKLKADRKLIKNQLSRQSGRIVLFKDLSNIRDRMKKGETRNDLDSFVRELQEKYGATVDIFH
ncbi:PREDICTED: uncharacterized protein LOC106809772 [Priapulus caudatus]|uniref:Uncharacterized protein LOC106809772 n=1 Tax=Priapulus caudatus TaxID=37621 RepID=A0ABM1E8D8_PRICU|nr:PREDICTED: uncharacterized protein LOC106809772 [Priapulus caudatus]